MNTTRLFVARRQRLHTPIPHRPSNEERVRAYRALAPVQLGNPTFAERFRAREYALDAMADSAPDFSEETTA